MGRKQGDTDLRTLQKHIAEKKVQWERLQWLKKVFGRKRRWKWLSESMTRLAFRMMVNETLRTHGMKCREYKGR